jgi:hypothetical protein
MSRPFRALPQKPTGPRPPRHGLLAAVSALAVPSIPALAARRSEPHPDAELIALLDEARRLCREWQAAPMPKAPTLAEITAPKPWEALIVQACAIPARTPEGMRAKAEAARWWVLGDSLSACDRIHTPQERLAVSLVADLLGRGSQT